MTLATQLNQIGKNPNQIEQPADPTPTVQTPTLITHSDMHASSPRVGHKLSSSFARVGPDKPPPPHNITTSTLQQCSVKLKMIGLGTHYLMDTYYVQREQLVHTDFVPPATAMAPISSNIMLNICLHSIRSSTLRITYFEQAVQNEP